MRYKCEILCDTNCDTPMNTPKAKYRLHFDRYDSLTKDKNGEALVQIEIYFSRTERKWISSGVHLKAGQWDGNNNLVTSKHANFIALNQLIKKKINDIEAFELTRLNNNQPFNSAILDEFLNGAKFSNDDALFIEFYEQQVKLDNSIKKGTVKEHMYSLNMIKEFNPNVRIQEIDYDFVKQFDFFLRSRKLAQNTIQKHHKHVSKFLNIATKMGKFDRNKNPYEYFKSKKVKSDRLNLTSEEIERIEALKVLPQFADLVLARDLFLFSCFTGMRFSDMQALSHKNVITNKDGIAIKFTMEKVPKPIELHLYLLFNGRAEIILKKYYKPENDFIFPRISNQHVNRTLKALATMSELTKVLTFHISRHTFGSALADISANPYLIMDLMGHADIKTSMIYIHSSQERINKQLRGLSWNTWY